MEFVEEVSTRTILINKGKLVDDGEPVSYTHLLIDLNKFFQDIFHHYIQALLLKSLPYISPINSF